MQLMFGWECHPYWYKIAHIIELFIMDAFVDLFITLCIVVNTVFMALDHADMNPTLADTLKYGNYVRRCAIASTACSFASSRYTRWPKRAARFCCTPYNFVKY